MADNQHQKSGADSSNLQAGRDIVLNNNKIVLYSIEEVSKKLLASAFGELPQNTLDQVTNNQKSYFEHLSEKLHKINKQSEEIKATIDSPDFQYTSKKAAISASRSSSKELHDNLSSLIIQRINYDKEDLQRIVYNEAISTVEKLTQNQLKILTFFFLITRTKLNGLKSANDIVANFNVKIIPFVDFKISRIEFDHLAYTGCATFSIGSHDLAQLIKNNYSEIFATEEEVKKMFTDNTVFARLSSVWKEPVSNMNLTSVGVALAITYYEQVVKEKLDANIWLAAN